ncbi:MAG: cysteine desulfurase family protein [Candidatus Dadabacteria bacterium]|nr:cysteine desulfurase family protein [Candidatus Dadabacteria bacterium]
MQIGNTLYLDHQATTPVDPRVFSEMSPFFSASFGNPHSSDHSLGWESLRAVETSASRIARLIGADEDEIIFTSGATESNNLALLGIGRRAVKGNRHRILLSAIEHKCVLAAGRVLQEQYGFMVESIPVNREGFADLARLEKMLDEDVLLVSVMAVNNEIGTIQETEAISKLVRKHGALFHCDAAQAPVAIDVNLAKHTDMLSLSAHKMYGPKGIGVAYISREIRQSIEPLIYGGGQQEGLRSGTIPVALCVGMGAAADLMVAGDISEGRNETLRRRNLFIEKLQSLRWPVSVNGPLGDGRHPGNANVCFAGFSAHDILSALQPHLAASTGSACTSGIPESSHVLKAIGLDSDSADSSIRFSLGFETSDEDINEATILIEETLRKLAKSGRVCSA